MQDLRRITENDFVLGYNDTDKPENLWGKNRSYMADIVNAFIEDNKIIQRNGYSSIGNAPASKKILGEARHEPHGGTKYILRARDNAGGTQSVVESWSGSGNWATLTGATTQTAGARHEFVTIKDATYILNDSNDTVLKTTNGTSASSVAAIPKGIDGAWFHNFFFVFGVSTNQSRLYFSDVNTPETFDGVNGYIDVNPGDNEPIEALSVLSDQLLIFKESRVWSLTGFGTADFTLSDLGERATNIGTKASRSVVETGNDVFFLSYLGKTPHIRSMRRTAEGTLVDGGIVSDKIEATMTRINTTHIDKACGVFDGERVWFALPMDTSTEPDEVIVLNLASGGWTRHTGINASVMHISTISGEPVIYFGSSENDGKSHQLDTSTNDDGDAIDYIVITPAYAPQPGVKSKFKYLYITADVESDVDLDVDYSPDGFTWDDLATVSLTGLGAKFGSAVFGTSKFGATTIVKQRVDTGGGTAYFMQYRFRNNVLDEEVTLREWEIFYKVRALRATQSV